MNVLIPLIVALILSFQSSLSVGQEFNFEDLKDRTIELYRSSPWGKASRTVPFYLFETSGTAEIKDLMVYGQEIYVKDTRIVVPGQVTLALPRQDSPSGVTLRARDRIELDITFSGLERTGSFVTQLVVNSPSLGASRFLPVNLVVSDKWGFPLFVIFLGVLGGFLTHYLSERWRPRQDNNYRIARLRGLISSLRGAVRAPEKLERLQSLWDGLRSAEEKNYRGDFAEARVQLDQVEKDVEAFRKEEVKEKAKALAALSDLRAVGELYQRQLAGLTAEETKHLQAILNELREAEALLWADQVDLANERLEDVRGLLEDFKKQRLQKDLEVQKRQLEELGAVPDEYQDDKQQIEVRLGEVRHLLARGDLEEARKGLDEVEVALEGLRSKLAVRRGKPFSPVVRRFMTGLREAEEVETRPRIEILDLPENRTTDTTLSFQIKDPKGMIQPGDRLRWDFGEGGALEEGGRSVFHRFKEPGDYPVKALVLRGAQDELVMQLSQPVKILPGRTERSLEQIRRHLQLGDLVLSGIALVLASLTGLLYLYVDKTFGSLQDYLLAFLWGFGIDSSVRGFTDVLKKITGVQ